MNKLILGATFAVALIGFILGASAKDQPGQRFITKAIEGNLAEIQMGQLAQQKADSDGVRSFGQQLVTDHTAANRSATSVANKLGVTPPTEPSKKHKAM